MTLFKLAAVIVLSAVLVFYGGLLLALRRAFSDTPSPAVRAQVRNSPPRIEVSITVARGQRNIKIESIMLPREVAETLVTATPADFRLGTFLVPDPEALEPDLEELTEQPGPVSSGDIERVTAEQHREHVDGAAAMERRYVIYEGTLIVRRGTTATVVLPAERAEPMEGLVSVTFADRAWLWRGRHGASAALEWVPAT